jgi:uncharacterized protein YndB with AHSA1/START domain
VLFSLWTAPAQLVRWWAPDGYLAEVHLLETRPGGRWRTTLVGPDGRISAMCGVYRVVEPPRRLVFTWSWEDETQTPGHETEVTVTFDPIPGGTRLALSHRRFENSTARGRHSVGWSGCFDRLAKLSA